jgi:DMSO/TMAO reductase YedYZ molybdopterin-dependent catalytic subunit
MTTLLTIDGLVARPARLGFDDLAALDASQQIPDVSRIDPKRRGQAVTLAGLLAHVGAKPDAQYLGLHSSSDDFHASIPLVAVREKAILIYQLEGQPLPVAQGGPVRFFIPDFAACHTHEIDECANVKFVDRIELTRDRGPDNRPHDGAEHEALHAREDAGRS